MVGDFFRFRDALLQICKIKNMAAVRSFEIRTEQEKKRLNLKLVFYEG